MCEKMHLLQQQNYYTLTIWARVKGKMKDTRKIVLEDVIQFSLTIFLDCEYSFEIEFWDAIFRYKLDSILLAYTVFENHPKCRICSFEFWHFSLIFDLLKLLCLVTLFDLKLGFRKLGKLDHFRHFLMNFCPLQM